MKVEDSVLSIEQMQHLKELGLEVKDTATSWTKYPVYELDGKLGWRWRVIISEDGTMCKDGLIPTLTLQEILEMLPTYIYYDAIKYSLNVRYNDKLFDISYMNVETYANTREVVSSFLGHTYIESAYKMLCWASQYQYLKQ